MKGLSALLAAVFLAATLCKGEEAAKFQSRISLDEGSTAGLSREAKTEVLAGLRAFTRGDMALAEKAFRHFLQLAPNNTTGLVNLGVVEYRLKHFEDAEKLLKKAVHLKPDAAPAWLALGVIYYESDNMDAALAELSQATLLDPKNAQAHNYLGVTIGRKGWTSGAEQELESAIALDPGYAEAHFNLALFSLQRSPPAVELARRHYQKALDLGEPRDPLLEKELNDADASTATPAPAYKN